GSCLNRIESIMTLQDNNIINLNSKKSLIKDADIAEESTNLTQTQILQQITSSLFTQANQINGNLALRLLGVG
ncbi:MAG: flagellin, partial [Candidatus Gastranaerophilales bacterium]|nr:flagellin [Candidatus Gastranaerophilales bacterium]